MGIHLADQTLVFLQSCLAGMLLGLLYDAFRISRIAVPTHPAVVFVEDVLFFLLCAVATFLFLLRFVDGRVRIFLLIGELLGAVLYFCTVGQLVMGVSKAIIHAIKATVGFIVRWIVLPVWRLFYRLTEMLLRPVRFLGKIAKKLLQKIKFRLKIGRIILYNHSVYHLRAWRNARKQKEQDAYGEEGRQP